MIAKLPSEIVVELYERHADRWDALRGAALPEKGWMDRFLSHLPVQDASILDIGCGAGQPVARYFIDKGCHVTGIDTSPSLLAKAQSRFPAHSWHLADMRHFSPPGAFHGLVAWDSFFHLTPEDQTPMFDLFRRAAAPGAVLMFTSGPGYGEAIGKFEGEPLYHGSLDADMYRRLLRDNGFGILDHVVEDPDCGKRTVWLAQNAG